MAGMVTGGLARRRRIKKRPAWASRLVNDSPGIHMGRTMVLLEPLSKVGALQDRPDLPLMEAWSSRPALLPRGLLIGSSKMSHRDRTPQTRSNLYLSFPAADTWPRRPLLYHKQGKNQHKRRAFSTIARLRIDAKKFKRVFIAPATARVESPVACRRARDRGWRRWFRDWLRR